MLLSTDIPAALFLLAQIFFVTSAIIFAISAIDDLFIDVYFATRWISAKRRFTELASRPTAHQLTTHPEQPLALMLPAWQEANVIYAAVRTLVLRAKYSRFHVFIGTYPNDLDTQREVDRLTREFPNIHKVVTSRPGPTCKADCLNAIIYHIRRFEQKNRIQFLGVVMQDAEDVVHPLSLKLFNFLLPHFDLIQIPVFSLKRKWNDLTGGHYMDEFAEFHSKEILVREQFAGVVPGAGVGTAYSRRALAMAAAQQGEIFSTHSLTEDYEFSFRLHDAGLKQTFARVPVEDESNVELNGESTTFEAAAGQYIATREYFPNRFWAAVRQKTRWTIGISLQGWKSFGWTGSWRIRYLFWRDRKMLVFSHAILLGFTSIAVFLALSVYRTCAPDGYRLAPLVAADNPLWYVVYFNIGVLFNRIIQRHVWTYLYYGWSALPMVTPRYVWGAAINYLAICRALKTYAAHRLTGRHIGWDKTSHDFPVEFNLNHLLPQANGPQLTHTQLTT